MRELQNFPCKNCLKVKLGSIRPEDVVDGNQKVIMNLLWTIVRRFQNQDSIDHPFSQETIADSKIHVSEICLCHFKIFFKLQLST